MSVAPVPHEEWGVMPVDPTSFPELVEVWEASVRATHTFLSEADIAYFKPLILQQYLAAVRLACVCDDASRIAGFIGTHQGKIEMLFVRPDHFGRGIGRRLVTHAITAEGAVEVDVNQQNESALVFYERLGFVKIGRSVTDSLGKPFPLLHLRLP